MLDSFRKIWDRIFGINWATECLVFDKSFDSHSIRYLIQLLGGKIRTNCPTSKKYILITKNNSKKNYTP